MVEPHVFGLPAGDAGTWVGAIASFLAVAVALGLALAGAVGKWMQRRADVRVSASFLYSELVRALSMLDGIVVAAEQLRGLAERPDGAHLSFKTMEWCSSEIESVTLRLAHTHVRSLNGRDAEDLAMSVGSFPLLCAGVKAFVAAARLPGNPWSEISRQPDSIVENARISKQNMRRYFVYCERRFDARAHKKFLG